MGAKRMLVVSTLSLLSGVALACGGDAAGPSPSEITGTWQATKVEHISTAQPTVSVDLIADEDFSVTLVLATNGNYTFTQTAPGEPPQTSTGTWELDGDVFDVAPTGTQYRLQFEIALSGNTLSLSGADAEYDFDGDDTPEDAKLNMVFTR